MVDLQNLGALGERLRDVIVCIDFVAAHRDKRQERECERLGIDQGTVSAYDTPGLELSDSLHNRRRRQPDVPGNFGLGLPGVGLEELEDPEVERIDVSVVAHIQLN